MPGTRRAHRPSAPSRSSTKPKRQSDRIAPNPVSRLSELEFDRLSEDLVKYCVLRDYSKAKNVITNAVTLTKDHYDNNKFMELHEDIKLLKKYFGEIEGADSKEATTRIYQQKLGLIKSKIKEIKGKYY